MLEKMGEFFDRRLADYDEHQLNCIDSAREFLRFTAEHLPQEPGCSILDLGCGTGLELEFYFPLNLSARITGIDLAPGMLQRLRDKFPGKAIRLIEGSYFDIPFGRAEYDAAVSVESLHHFTAVEKLPLYQKLTAALKPGGFFLLTDYFALSDEEEWQHKEELVRLKAEQGISDGSFYHYDTPLTVAHEADCLRAAGFTTVEVLNSWGATHTIRAAMV